MKGEMGERAFDGRGVPLAGLAALIGAGICLAAGLFLAIPTGDSVFLAFLLGGAGLGALGGLLAAGGDREGRPLATAPDAASR